MQLFQSAFYNEDDHNVFVIPMASRVLPPLLKKRVNRVDSLGHEPESMLED